METRAAVAHAAGQPLSIETVTLAGPKEGEVVVEITDELFEENAGVWRISVINGQGRIERTTEPAQAKLDIGAFAPLYMGYQNASQLKQSDRISGDAIAIQMLDGLFAASTPTMADDF